MNKRKVGIIVGVLALLAVCIIWIMRGRADAQMQKVRDLGKEAFAGGQPDREKMKQFRDEMDKLSPDQRDKLRDEGRREFERRENEEMAKFFEMPPAQRNDYLDKRIRDEEKWRKERESRRAQQGQQPNQPGPGANASAGGNGGGNANGGQQRGRRNLSSDEKMQRRNKRLDSSTPEQRAQRSAFRAAMDKRRKELGLPPQGRPPFRG
jgi:hypothetical protein